MRAWVLGSGRFACATAWVASTVDGTESGWMTESVRWRKGGLVSQAVEVGADDAVALARRRF
jgi:hypothetical protein